jgi:hypothetical protein
MKNEPVAWKVIETDDDGSFTTFTEIEPVWSDRTIPLYTHPVKELTDEEITSVFRASSDHIEFAREILRKAQEK